MNHKFESTYFKTDKVQAQGPQARCHEWGDKNLHQFFVAIDGPSKNEYASYKDSSVFLKMYNDVPNDQRCFFEQIREATDGNEIQRLELQVFAAFLRMRNQHAPEYALDNEHCRVLSASNDKKVSLHIVIPTYVFENNNEHMKAFILAFQGTWRSASDEDSALLKHIDTKVYTKNRLMRILWSCKFKDTGRPLQRAQWHGPLVAEDEEFLITSPGPDCIQSAMPQQLVDTVKAKFMQTPQATQFEMHCKQDCAMIFGLCIVCKREHSRDIAYLRLTESGVIFFHCRRSTSLAGVEVCKRDFALAVDIEAVMALQTPHGLTHVDILDDARFLTQDRLAPPEHLQLGHGKFEVHEQQPRSLLIRCDTGGDKTVFTEALVKANKKSRFVAITCDGRWQICWMRDCALRTTRTFRRVRSSRVVVQTQPEVLLRGTILILDEASLLIKQMCSDKTHGNMHNLNLQVFERLIQRATRVICLDADLSDEEVEIMKSLRSDFIVINNTFQQQKDDNVVLFDSKWKLIEEALDLLRTCKRLCTEALHAMLTKAGFKGKCVTKNVDEAFKRNASKDINNVMADLDYFIHTPTISVGVDYNAKDHVDYVVGIFSTRSEVDVETCMQMMRRVRHVKSKTYLVHADAAVNDLPATAPEVKDWICNQLDIVTGKVRWSSTLKLQFDDANDPTIPDDLHHRMYCHVMAKKHLSMNNFRSRLIQRMAWAGCIVTGRGDKLPRGHPIPKELKEEENAIAAAWHQQIASAVGQNVRQATREGVLQEFYGSVSKLWTVFEIMLGFAAAGGPWSGL
ncbi:MAG: hypothetical protein JOS17DRAFT_839563 [Linnemannia elongata]|nr:MAG: hypothetical protein JOS17DRAFT_839563 [Linnemannia elongata]